MFLKFILSIFFWLYGNLLRLFYFNGGLSCFRQLIYNFFKFYSVLPALVSFIKVLLTLVCWGYFYLQFIDIMVIWNFIWSSLHLQTFYYNIYLGIWIFYFLSTLACIRQLLRYFFENVHELGWSLPFCLFSNFCRY